MQGNKYFKVNNFRFTTVNKEGCFDSLLVAVNDLKENYRAVLKLNNPHSKFCIISSTFVTQSKRRYEMMYLAELTKKKIIRMANGM
jgi:gluconate kinase